MNEKFELSKNLLEKVSKNGYNTCMDTPSPSKQIEILKTKPISKRGGARIGAGRKPKLQFEVRELFNMSVDQNWDLLMKKVWEAVRNGDRDMIKFVLEQKIGKPAQAIDIKKEETRINYNLFYQPKVREAVKVLEEKIKGEITKEIMTIKDTDGDNDIS